MYKQRGKKTTSSIYLFLGGGMGFYIHIYGSVWVHVYPQVTCEDLFIHHYDLLL